jgi:hypothetical protein
MHAPLVAIEHRPRGTGEQGPLEAARSYPSPTSMSRHVVPATRVRARRSWALPCQRHVRVVSPGADLLRRVFADDVLQCPCGGRRSVIAIVTDPRHAQTLVTALGLSSEPVTFAPARSPPQAKYSPPQVGDQ